MTEEKR
jgi:hypothetical protein